MDEAELHYYTSFAGKEEFDLRDSGAVLWQLWQDWMIICFAYFRLGCGGHRFLDSCVEKKQ